MMKFSRLLNPLEAAPAKYTRPRLGWRRADAPLFKGVFGGGGGGSSVQQMIAAAQAQQAAQAARDAQGQQLALIAKQQSDADAESASLKKPGLGRALLTYRGQQKQTLGG